MRCEGCLWDHHFDPPMVHTWFDAQDVAEAAERNVPIPTGACTCYCSSDTTDEARREAER